MDLALAGTLPTPGESAGLPPLGLPPPAAGDVAVVVVVVVVVVEPPALPPSAAITLADSLKPLDDPAPAPAPPLIVVTVFFLSPLLVPLPVIAPPTAPLELEKPFLGIRNPIAPEDEPIAFGAPCGPSAPAYLPPPSETPTWLGAACPSWVSKNTRAPG